MILTELLTTMARQGIRFDTTPEGGLCAVAPPGALTPEIATALKIHRDAVAEVLGIKARSTNGTGTVLLHPQPAAGATPSPPCVEPTPQTVNETSDVRPAAVAGQRPAPDRFGAEGWKATYHLVNTQEQFRSFLLQLGRQNRFAIDLETTSLDPALARIVGYSVCWQTGEAWYLPVQAPEGETHLDYDSTLEQLRPFLEDPDVVKLNQNIKYDLSVLRHHRVRVAGVKGDPMVADYLLRAGERNHGLDDLALRYLNYQTIPITDLIGKKRGKKKPQLSMAQVPLEKITAYASEDADMAFRLGDKLEDRLHRQGLGKLYEDLEIPLIQVLVELETNGICLDVPLLEGLSQELAEPLAKLEEEIYELAGHAFNLNSHKQIRQVLYDEKKLSALGFTKEGEKSTNAESLAQLAAQGHELPGKVGEYRTLAKLKSTYVDALPRLVNPLTGRLHTSFNQTVTATGRLSSSNPNLQNIPSKTEDGRKIRQAFIPHEGWLLLKADYSQIELRMLADFSGDSDLRRAFQQDRDIHNLVAGQCFEVPEEAVTGDQRRFAKTINFGIIYGMSAHGLANRLKISVDDASKFIDAYFARYPAVAGYQDELLNQCRLTGYVGTLLGRRRYIQGIRLQTSYRDRNEPEREAVNMQIQGSAADLIKLAMLNIYRRLVRGRFRARMLLTVHDELVFEVPPDELQTVIVLVTEEMEEAFTLSVPLKADLAVGLNWLDMEKLNVVRFGCHKEGT